jgi:Mn-dependent DtxR family transcriptional regulator
VTRLDEHLKWSPQFAQEIVRLAQRDGLIQHQNGLLTLTDSGLRRSQQEFSA